MAWQFLSDEWFEKLNELTAAAGDIETPSAMQDLVINITVTEINDGDVDMSLNSGVLEKGHSADAPTKIILPVELARRLFIDNDQSAGMQGFMSGQIKVEGDMNRLMAMQTVQPSEKQRALQKQILEMTAS